MPSQLDRIKTILKESGLEIQENFQRIISHLRFSYLDSAIEALHEAGLLNEKSLNALIENKNSLLISDSIQLLNKAKLYNEEKLEVVLNFAKSLEILSNGGIATQEEIAFVLKHQCPVEAAYALVNLQAKNLLNEKFIAAL